MIGPTHDVALTVAAVSFAFALGMVGSMLMLVFRRGRQEGVALAEEELKLAASRALMRALTGREPEPDAHDLPTSAWLAALSHLLRLLRGNDRNSLLALAEQRGLFNDALAGLHHRRASRRVDAMRLVEQFDSAECIAGLGACLQSDPSMAVRLEAAAALARLGALPPVDILVGALRLAEQPVTRLHAALFRSLAKRDARALAELASARGHASGLQALLVEALGWTSDPRQAGALAVHAADPDPEVRCAAVRAARHLGSPAVKAWLVPLLLDPSEAVRVQAAQTCGLLRLADSIPFLERLATEPSWWVRTRARGSLETLRPHHQPTIRIASTAA